VSTVTIAIDIGLTGSVAAVDWQGRAEVHDMPTVAVRSAQHRTVKRRIDPTALRVLLFRLAPAVESAEVVFEDIHAGTGPGSAARASLMHSRGVIEAVAELAGMEWHAVTPANWKRHYGLINAQKDASRVEALKLFPQCADSLKRKKDHNRAEGLLIARYGRAQRG
jgi:hypothetical protein